MKRAILAAVVVVSVGAVMWGRRDAAPAMDSKRLVLDRVWIDHIPRSEQDTVQAFVAVSERAVGGFNATSVWRGSYELFRFEASGELRLTFPQTGDRETVRAKATSCSESGMDYCLELEGSRRGARRYFSRKGWEIDSRAGTEAMSHRIDEVRRSLTP